MDVIISRPSLGPVLETTASVRRAAPARSRFTPSAPEQS